LRIFSTVAALTLSAPNPGGRQCKPAKEPRPRIGETRQKGNIMVAPVPGNVIHADAERKRRNPPPFGAKYPPTNAPIAES